MDPAWYARVIERCFPNVGVKVIRYLGGGSCRVFLVNEELVFRFPHGEGLDEDLRWERNLYEWLAPRLPAPVPRYTHFAEGCPQFPHPVAGYRRLPGIGLEHLGRAPSASLAAQVGRFLSALHTLPLPPGAEDRPAARDDEWMREFYGRIRRVAFPALDMDERVWVTRLFEDFLADPADWDEARVLIHGDFDTSNILCDPATGDLTAVIDFEDAGPGDPTSDFCGLRAELGPTFVDAVLAAYTAPTDFRFRERLEFRARVVLFHELLYGLEYDAPAHTAHGRERLHRAMSGEPVIGGWLPGSTAATREWET